MASKKKSMTGLSGNKKGSASFVIAIPENLQQENINTIFAWITTIIPGPFEDFSVGTVTHKYPDGSTTTLTKYVEF